MNDIKDVKRKYNFIIKKYYYVGKSVIVYTDKGNFIVKRTNGYDKDNLYNSLSNKKFFNYVRPYILDDDYEIYPYLETIEKDDDDRALDIIYLISILHNKTTFYKKFNIDDKKSIYEEILNNLNYLTDYYDNLRWIIEEELYPAPSSYLLLRNITLLYSSIDYSLYFLNKWYELVKNADVKRVARVHGNLKLSHLIENDNLYLISWDNSKIDIPIVDIYNFYKNNYLDLDFSSLFSVYLSKYQLLDDEKYLFFSLILMPEKVDLTNNEIINIKNVYNLIEYVSKSNYIVSKHYSKESNHEAGNKK